MPKLLIQNEDQAGQVFDLTSPRYTVGRVAGNSIVIQHKSISSHHAELVLDGKDYKVKDLDSTNGTKVNGERAQEVKLRRSDVVRFGNVDLLYESEHAPDVLPLPDPNKGVNLAECSAKGRPPGFKNISPIPREVVKSKIPWFFLISMAALVGVAGVIFFVLQMLGLV